MSTDRINNKQLLPEIRPLEDQTQPEIRAEEADSVVDPRELRASLEQKLQLMKLLEQGGYQNFGTVIDDVSQAITDLDAIIEELEICPEQA